MEQLVYNAEVLNIESDTRPFTHNTDLNSILEQKAREEKKSKKNEKESYLPKELLPKVVTD